MDVFKQIMGGLELTPDEQSQVKGCVSHPGWRILVEKVWARQCMMANDVCRIKPNTMESVKHAGIYEGIQLSERVARETAYPEQKSKKPPSQEKRVRNSFRGDTFSATRSGSRPS
jgi:hypothetical protein